MKLILASASPRRRELLTQIGVDFEVQPAQGEEKTTKVQPDEVVMELAEQKAREIYESNCENLILGADTVVVYQGEILGKPKDEADALRMLSMLSGNVHEVYTGVSLLCQSLQGLAECSGKSPSFHSAEDGHRFFEKTAVTMYPITEAEILDYIKSGEPMDKAGAYGIQGMGAKFIKKIDGDYNNVVGLPVARIYQELMQLGIAIFRNS